MNRRQWKKACKKAAAELERRWPGEYEVVPADGDETVHPPRGYVPSGKPRAGMNRRMWRLSFRYDSPPKGTPLVWERTSYEYDEWDARTALEVLEDRTFVEETDWEAVCRESAEPDFDDMLSEACRAIWFALQRPEAA